VRPEAANRKENIMKSSDTSINNTAIKVGLWVMVSWAVLLGPIGFALLCALAYAMYFSNLALGIVCCLLLASPLLFLAVWVPLMGASLIVESSAAREALAPETETL
jgi:hypothetical protein